MKSNVTGVLALTVSWLLCAATVATEPNELKLPKGEFEIREDKYGHVVRVNRNRIKNWNKVPGIKKAWPAPGPNGESESYIPVTSEIKDVDKDGRLDIFRVIINEPYSQLARFDYDGKLIWKSDKFGPFSGDESGLPVEDLDGDGKYECLMALWRTACCIDAESGKTKWTVDFERGVEPNTTTWDCLMMVGHFFDKKQYTIVVRAGLKVYHLDANGNVTWTYQLAGHNYGHELHCYDVDGDGYDEIFIGRNGNVTALDNDGRLLWEDTSQKNHTDFFAFGDIDEDGRCEVIYDHDGCGGSGPLYIVDACTGKRKLTVDYRSEGLKHAQGLSCADFRPDLPGLEFACTDKSSFLIMWDAKGNILWKNDTPTSLNTVGDWDGDGIVDLLVFTIGYNVDPAMSVWNGHGKRLYAISWLPSPVRSHAIMCGPGEGFDGFRDLDGNGKADVLVAFGPWNFGPNQYLFLMEAPEKSVQ